MVSLFFFIRLGVSVVSWGEEENHVLNLRLRGFKLNPSLERGWVR